MPIKKMHEKAIDSNSNQKEIFQELREDKQLRKSNKLITSRQKSTIQSTPKKLQTKGSNQPTTNTRKKTSSLATFKPSATLNKHKQANPWGASAKKCRTNFSQVYTSGGIPCRINHGNVKHTLKWDRDIETLDYDPLLITCIEGIMETEHPYVLISRHATRDLLKANGARNKVLPILGKIILPIRTALMAANTDIICEGMELIELLSDLVQKELNVYICKFLQKLHSHMNTAKLKQKVSNVLYTIAQNGGKEALSQIRLKIPTFVSL